ncbi:MAG: hypothetical protein ABIJ72_00195 [bacterium]
MSHSHLEPPRSLVAAIWSIVGLIAVFIAVGFSSIFVLRYFYPVSAEVATVNKGTGECKDGKIQVAVNNYPGLTAITKSQYNTHDKVLKALGGDNFRCSEICVPGLSGSLTKTQEDKKIVSDFITKSSGSINGKPIMVLDDGDSFMAKIAEWQKQTNPAVKQSLTDDLNRAVIVNSTKTTCAGPNSEDYGPIVVNGQEIPVVKKNTTAEEAKKAAEEKRVAEEKQAAIQPELPEAIAEVQREVKAPTGAVTTDKNWKCLRDPVVNKTKYYWYRLENNSEYPNGGWILKNDSGKKYGIAANKLGDVEESKNPTKDCGAIPGLGTEKLNNCLYDAGIIVAKFKGEYATGNMSMYKISELDSWMKTYMGLYNRRQNSKDPDGDLEKCRKLLGNLHIANEAIINYKSGNAPSGVDRVYTPSEQRTTQQNFKGTTGTVWQKIIVEHTATGWRTYTTKSRNGLEYQVTASWVHVHGQKNNYFWSLHSRNGRYYWYNPSAHAWELYSRNKVNLDSDINVAPTYYPGTFKYF